MESVMETQTGVSKQKKQWKQALETSTLNSSSITPGRSLSKTPNSKGTTTTTNHKLNKSGSRKTPSGGNGKGTVVSAGGDRFIPGRTNFEMANYLLSQTSISDTSSTASKKTASSSTDASRSNNTTTGDDNAPPTDQQDAAEFTTKKQESSYSRSLTESLLGVSDLSQTRVLSFAKKPNCPPEGYQNALKVIYQGGGCGPSTLNSGVPLTKYRVIPKTPERVLDAPDVEDDFYLNFLDWSRNNVVGIALGDQVYLWTAHTAEITKIPCDKHDA